MIPSAAVIFINFLELIKMSYPSIKEAEDFFEYVIKERNSSPYPFLPEWERTYREHCKKVAKNAQKIASQTPDMNPEVCYCMGLLHDCGRIRDEKAENRHHGWVGYQLMSSKGWNDIARICITHNFYEKDFDIKSYPIINDDVVSCQKFLSQIEYNDYDYLMQLTDVLNDMGKDCTIEYRFSSLANRYPINKDQMMHFSNIIKSRLLYFNKKCNGDIYELLGVK